MEAKRFLNYKEEFFMMLRFRKMMAVLLAAALTLTMLTACGGGGRGGNAVNEKVELTKSVNEALKKDGYKAILKYDTELDKTAYDYRTTDARSMNADWERINLNRRMFKVYIKEAEKANSASEIAKEIGPTLKKGDDWRIGYYIEPKVNNKQEVVIREFTIILEWKEVTK